MVVGSIVIKLSVPLLPEGLSFTITEVNAIKPEGSWYTYASIPTVPFTVDPKVRDGWIGEFTLSSTSTWESGAGASFEIKFNVSGTMDGRTSSRDGHITLSTPEWGMVARPDYTSVIFVLDGSAPHTLDAPTPQLQTPDPISLAFVYDPRDRCLKMSATTERQLINQAIDVALLGIFAAHKKAAEWAVGKVW